MARLAAWVPPPWHPLTRFHGVLAPHHAWRSSVVPEKTAEEPTGCRRPHRAVGEPLEASLVQAQGPGGLAYAVALGEGDRLRPERLRDGFASAAVALTPSGQLGSNLCQRDTFFAHGTSCARDRVRPAEGSSRTLTAKTQEAERAAKEIERAAKDAERAARQQAEARVAELEAALEALEKKRGPAR
jgi:hypothetical protein